MSNTYHGGPTQEEWRAKGLRLIVAGAKNAQKKTGIAPRVKTTAPSTKKKKRTTGYKSTEKSTQTACINLLHTKRIFHWRNNTGVVKIGARYIRYGYPGSPDIIAVINGRFVGIEVKDVKTKQNDNQKKFQEDLERAGGIYIVIRNIDELIKFLSKPL